MALKLRRPAGALRPATAERPLPPGAGVEVRGLRHRYRASGGGPLGVLDGVDLDVAPGQYVAVQGASGAGKSTLLSVLGGLERPQEGTVRVGGVDLSALAGDALAAYRRSTVGFVFQHFGLLEALTAVENVELALALSNTPRRLRRPRAAELLDEVGLSGRVGHLPAALSGGERQRVAIARALAADPQLLLADEPTGNLDEGSAEKVVELLEAVGARGTTLVVVTHNRALAARAGRRVRLEAGRLAEVLVEVAPAAGGAGDEEDEEGAA